MRRALLAMSFVVVISCASILDIPRLEAPPVVDGGPDAGSCPATGILTRTRRGLQTALDDTDVYFTHAEGDRESTILRCAKCGCAAPTEVGRVGQPGGIAVDERYVFWTDTQEDGSLSRFDKLDPTKPPLRITNQLVPKGVTIDDTYVYWTVIGTDNVSTAGVYRARKVDLGEVTLLAKAQDFRDNVGPYALAVDDTHVYYTVATNLDSSTPSVPCNGANGTVRRVLKRGGLQASTVVARGQACPVGIALSEDAVYWLNLGASAAAGSVWRTPKGAGTATLLVDKLGSPTSLALYGGRLAWDVPGTGHVESCTVPRCGDVETLARDQPNPSGVSADSSGLYWVVHGTGGQNFEDGALRRASPF